jgi:hypothetical protein
MLGPEAERWATVHTDDAGVAEKHHDPVRDVPRHVAFQVRIERSGNGSRAVDSA